MVVALVFGVATIAFADTYAYVEIEASANVNGGTDSDGEHFDVTFTLSDVDGWFVGRTDGDNITITAKDSEKIREIEFSVGWTPNGDPISVTKLAANAGTFSAEGTTVSPDDTLTLNVTGDVTTVTINWTPAGEASYIQFNSAKIYYGDPIPPTGDNSTAPIWFITFMVAAMGLAGTFVFGKKVR